MTEKARDAANRFLLFAGDYYYAAGGWADFRGSFATLDEARTEAMKTEHRHPLSKDLETWWQIVDAQTESVIEENGGTYGR